MSKETIIYINTTAVRSGLPDGLCTGYCHGVVRSVLPDGLLVATVS